MKSQVYDINELQNEGTVTITYPEYLRKAVMRAVTSWQAFCSLPLQTKLNLPYSNNADGFGYEHKDGSGFAGDKKENFDVALRGREWLEANASKIEGYIPLQFIGDALDLVEVMKTTVFDFARRVENELWVEGFLEEVKASAESFFVRFIHYPGNRVVGDETCVAHTDQSCFTFHLYESLPGLQGFSFQDRKWIDMPVSSGQTVIFSAMQLQLRSKGKIRALAHRVVANKESSDPDGNGRYSAVCFIQLKNTPKYNKAVYGRLQELLAKHGADHTYDMPQIEFEKMFK